jgi:hypothetical protein
MNAVLIIPTGLGAEIGGHAGDANPVAKLIGSVCDTLILHPNVVNASDINEMPENALYVEGSILDRFLWAHIALERVNRNKMLLAVNKASPETINAVSAARATIGADIAMVVLKEPLRMIANMKKGLASGEVFGWEELVEQVNEYDFDALAIATPIEVDKETALHYTENGGVNPWGGVEAKASRLIANALDKPIAHSPFGHILGDFNAVVDPRIAAECVSVSYLHCILKGLHRAPRIHRSAVYSSKTIIVDDVDVLISPYGCYGEPHYACADRRIPIIFVRENKTVVNSAFKELGQHIYVENYWEAAGYVLAMKAGVLPESVRRPLLPTKVWHD